ncbi:MAG: FtsX-like permease family protein [Gemmatimonadota bacterium]
MIPSGGWILLLLVLGTASRALPAQAPVQVAVERRLAQRMDLEVGDTIALGTAPDSISTTAIIAAIYEPSPDPASITRQDFHLRMHVPDLAGLLGAPDRVDRFGVKLVPGVSPDSAATVLNRLAFGFRAHPSQAIATGSSQTFKVVSRFHRAIAVISIVASAVFLLCIMLLKVEERRKDAAVMLLVGVRRRIIFGAVVLEAMAVALIGSGLGVGLAAIAGSVTNFYYRRLFDTALIFSLITPGIVAFSVGLSLFLGVAAGAVAAIRLVRTPPLILWGR